MQFCFVGHAILKTEQEMLQLLTMCPRYAIPTGALRNACDYGLSVQPRSMQIESFAAQYRAAVMTDGFVQRKGRLHQLTHYNDDVLMVPKHAEWKSQSMVITLTSR